MMVKPSRLASWRATVLLPAPAGPSMATMGGVTAAGDTPAGDAHQVRRGASGAARAGRRQPPRRPTATTVEAHGPFRAADLPRLRAPSAQGHGSRTPEPGPARTRRASGAG